MYTFDQKYYNIQQQFNKETYNVNMEAPDVPCGVLKHEKK